MITYALLKKEETQNKLAAFEATAAAKYFAPFPFYQPTTLTDNTWSNLQLIAVHAGEVQGYMSATIDRNTQAIVGVGVVKFCEGHEEQFAADMAAIFEFLRAHFRSVRWSCVEGAPTEAIYRKIAANHGGGVVGTFAAAYRLPTGELARQLWFEVPGDCDPDGLTLLPTSFAA